MMPSALAQQGSAGGGKMQDGLSSCSMVQIRLSRLHGLAGSRAVIRGSGRHMRKNVGGPLRDVVLLRAGGVT